MDRPVVPATHLDLAFGDGVYTFKLGLEQLGELQTQCGERGKPASLGDIISRVSAGRYTHIETGESFGDPAAMAWAIRDLTETIRLALIGGKKGRTYDGRDVVVDAYAAANLVKLYVADAPLMAAWDLAAAILGARLVGYEGPENKPQRKKKASPKPPMTDGSTTQEP